MNDIVAVVAHVVELVNAVAADKGIIADTAAPQYGTALACRDDVIGVFVTCQDNRRSRTLRADVLVVADVLFSAAVCRRKISVAVEPHRNSAGAARRNRRGAFRGVVVVDAVAVSDVAACYACLERSAVYVDVEVLLRAVNDREFVVAAETDNNVTAAYADILNVVVGVNNVIAEVETGDSVATVARQESERRVAGLGRAACADHRIVTAGTPQRVVAVAGHQSFVRAGTVQSGLAFAARNFVERAFECRSVVAAADEVFVHFLVEVDEDIAVIACEVHRGVVAVVNVRNIVEAADSAVALRNIDFRSIVISVADQEAVDAGALDSGLGAGGAVGEGEVRAVVSDIGVFERNSEDVRAFVESAHKAGNRVDAVIRNLNRCAADNRVNFAVALQINVVVAFARVDNVFVARVNRVISCAGSQGRTRSLVAGNVARQHNGFVGCARVDVAAAVARVAEFNRVVGVVGIDVDELRVGRSNEVVAVERICRTVIDDCEACEPACDHLREVVHNAEEVGFARNNETGS